MAVEGRNRGGPPVQETCSLERDQAADGWGAKVVANAVKDGLADHAGVDRPGR